MSDTRHIFNLNSKVTILHNTYYNNSCNSSSIDKIKETLRKQPVEEDDSSCSALTMKEMPSLLRKVLLLLLPCFCNTITIRSRKEWIKQYMHTKLMHESTWGKEFWKRVLWSVGEVWRDAIVGLDFAKKMKLVSYCVVLFVLSMWLEDTLLNLTYPLC